MRILVVFASKLGGTSGLADMIGDALTHQGLDATVRCAAEDLAVDHYDAVIVVGAIYNGRWHRDARRFVRRNVAALRERPVWLAASGPLDDSARDGVLAPIPHVAQAAEQVDARGTVTFGGRLAADAKGFLAHAMAQKMAGDWRDPSQIAAFADQVARALAVHAPSAT